MRKLAPSRVVIDLSAYAHNLAVVRNRIPEGCSIMAVVKSDAYGMGSVPVARRAVSEGVSMLGVTTIEEGICLRKANITAPILVMVQPLEEGLPALLEHDLRVMISNITLVERLGELARRDNRVVSVHCKIDTGMGRLGFPVAEAMDALRYLTRISPIDIEAIATHFPDADGPEAQFTVQQIAAFKQVLKQVNGAGIPYELAHAANSAGIVNFPDSAFDMVRPGLMTYGVWPNRGDSNATALRSVVRWESRVILIKEMKAGASVGYGRTYASKQRMRVAIVPVGYADGFRHALGNRADVLIHGKRCPVRGSVCMDLIVIDITGLDGVRVGDTVTLIGSDGEEVITVREMADHADTVPNDILTGIGNRVSREYLE